ncbi:protein Mpv17 [Plodia interpunctella]|uniref:protein Mpv17 n=1 Tax=Plodia interpunctella TaxID=58824 RepID=UPI0023689899|nr:protein Mpv17 [Plodia interpunctella]XP_053601405.1 protein Mpv17 [Plodia interpunctella]
MQVAMKARGFFKLYQQALVRRPYLMQGLQSGILMGAGDLISQTVIEKKSTDINYKRTLQFTSIGMFVGGPALHVWYGVLHRYIGSAGKSVAIKKVFVDQCVFAPVFLFILLSAVGTLQGKTLEHVEKDIRTNYLDVLKTNYFIWPWVQLANFYYVPLQYQVLIVQTVALFWNTYLSWKTNKDKL